MARVTFFSSIAFLIAQLILTQVSGSILDNLDILKCAGLGLENLTPQDVTGIVNQFNLNDPNIPRTTPQLIQAAGYPAETHFVNTADGYILGVYRIPYGKAETSGSPGRPVVFIQHGLLASSDLWLLNYPDKNLAYRLADLGYDVWIGNSRGNKYSRNHTSLNPDQTASKFWDFSWHEMGKYDVPANIDYVLGKTNQQKLYYIGHSQGTTQYLAAMALNPSYNSKIRLSVLLAPVAYLTHTYSALAVIAEGSIPGLTDNLACAYGTTLTGEIANTNLLNTLLPYGCNSGITATLLCDQIIFLLMGYDFHQSQNELIPALVAHFPSGAATKQFLHYGQVKNSEIFRQFDYGPGASLLQILPSLPPLAPQWLLNYIVHGNQGVYNSPIPPVYNLNSVTAPVVLFAGPNDALADMTDVATLAPQIPGNIDLGNTPPFRTVNFECFNHADFTANARDVNPLLYDRVIALLPNY